MMRGQLAAAQGLLAAAHPGQGGGQGQRMMRGQPVAAQGLPAAASNGPYDFDSGSPMANKSWFSNGPYDIVYGFPIGAPQQKWTYLHLHICSL